MKQSEVKNQEGGAMPMTIVLCGGGSGGHITPLLAVARELKDRDSKNRLIYVGEKNGRFSDLVSGSRLFDECHYISAGKFRRYHADSFATKLFDFKTNILNIRDLFRFARGVGESVLLFRRLRADSVLLKGGFVCVPASIGARLAGSYIVTHDSDAVPGVSNRIAGKYANLHATGMPARYYSYPQQKTVYVGLPLDDRFRQYQPAEIRFLKEKFKIPAQSKVVLVTGGSLGARRLNDWSLQALLDVLGKDEGVCAVFIAGKGNVDQFKEAKIPEKLRKRISVVDFTDELFHYTAVADIVISRAGATTMAELGNQRKAVIVVPNPDLTGGHQMKNATAYDEAKAIVRLDESDIKHRGVEAMTSAVIDLLQDEKKRSQLSENLYAMLPDQKASQVLADILVDKPSHVNKKGIPEKK